MRTFLALPIPEKTIAALIDLQSTLPTGRPVPEDNLHLTLAYMGDVSESVLETLNDLLQTARFPAPRIAFNGLGTFAEMEQGLSFAAVAPSDTLTGLQSKVARLVRTAGAELPRRRFRPHVTLTRANRQPKGPARDRLAAALGLAVDIPCFTGHAMNLYHSSLFPTGARHEVLATYPLS